MWVNFYFTQRTINVVETIEVAVTEITESYVFFGIDTLSFFFTSTRYASETINADDTVH